jgi:prepilin-type N-terminal cleavage/methylation domain-containing protein
MVHLTHQPTGQPHSTSPTGVAEDTGRCLRRGGFTLVELMVVMAIMGLVVTTVSVSMEAILPGERLNTSIRELAADLMQVRTEAISRSMEFRMEYDLDGDRYRIATPYRIGGGRIVTTDDPGDEELRFYSPWTPMRDGVALASVYTGGEIHEAGRVVVRFDALGSATDHLVIVSQPAYGNAFTIEVLGLTGLIRMHDGVVIREPARDEDFD